jgi:hypothetical protein
VVIGCGVWGASAPVLILVLARALISSPGMSAASAGMARHHYSCAVIVPIIAAGCGTSPAGHRALHRSSSARALIGLTHHRAAKKRGA